MLRQLIILCLVFLLAACHNDNAAPVAKLAAVKQGVINRNSTTTKAISNDNIIAKEVQNFNDVLKNKHPDISKTVTQVNRIALGTNVLFELVTPEAILYTDKNVDYILVGNLIIGDGKSVENFTLRAPVQQALIAARAAQTAKNENIGITNSAQTSTDGSNIFKALPFESGLNYTYGNPVHHIAIFEDPDCEFCQKLEQSLEVFGSNLNMQVTVFPFILTTRHPNGIAHAKALLCAKNPAIAWKKWMLAAAGHNNLDKLWSVWAPQNAPNSTCPAAALVDVWENAGHALGFSSTPTIMFENGMTATGALSESKFKEMFSDLDNLKKAPTSQLVPIVPTLKDVKPKSPSLNNSNVPTSTSPTVNNKQ